MLTIQPTAPQKCTPHLLPARINHSGRIENTARYWTPTTDEKGTHHAAFRGRHLYGTSLALPENYTGAVLRITEKIAPQPRTSRSTLSQNGEDDEENEDDEEELPEEVKIAEQVGEFEDMVVWGHGGVVDEGDAFVRGVREWVGFAESVHCDEEGTKSQTSSAEIKAS